LLHFNESGSWNAYLCTYIFLAKAHLLSGQYLQVGPKGGKGKEVTVVKGEPLPPTPNQGGTYKLVDATKNKSGGSGS
jgi:hypothetical protein